MLPSLPRLHELSHHVLSTGVADFCLGATRAVSRHLPWGLPHLQPQKCPQVPLSLVQRWFNESRGMARDTASPAGLAGERRTVPRSEGKGTGGGAKPGISKARGCRWCLLSHQDTLRAGRDRGGDGTFYRPWGPWG